MREEVQAAINRLLAGKESIRVLEAGCGSMSHVVFPESCHITGIDVSQRQLDRNSRLNERILGDLQTHELPAESFDAVVCWNVLEHLKDPDGAVRRMAGALAPGGILVLACPNPWSFHGLGARLTPHWFHIWLYKAVGVDYAGRDDLGPFPTFMRPSIAPGALCRLAASCGLTVELRKVYVGNWRWGRETVSQWIFERALDGLAAALRVLTFGKYRAERAETRLVFRKTGPSG